MKHNFLILSLLFAVSARAEQFVVCDTAKIGTFPLTVTTTTDNDVSASILVNGAEWPVDGYQGLLFIGDYSGGVTITNSGAGYNSFSWTISSENTPTNGAYAVQILGAKGGRLKELGRGRMTVRDNPSREYLPAAWQTVNPAYIAAAQAREFAVEAYRQASNSLEIARQALEQADNINTNAVLALSAGLLAEHNTNAPAHPDLRQSMSNVLTKANEALARESITTNSVNSLSTIISAAAIPTKLKNPTNTLEWAEIRGNLVYSYSVARAPCWRLTHSAVLGLPAGVNYSSDLPFPISNLVENLSGTYEATFGAIRLKASQSGSVPVLIYNVDGTQPDGGSSIENTVAILENTSTNIQNTFSFGSLSEFNPPYGTTGTTTLEYGDWGFTRTNVVQYRIQRNLRASTVGFGIARKSLKIVATNSDIFSSGQVFTNALQGQYDNVYSGSGYWFWTWTEKTVSGTNEYGQVEYTTDRKWLGDTSFNPGVITESTYFGRPIGTDSIFPFRVTNRWHTIEFYREFN